MGKILEKITKFKGKMAMKTQIRGKIGTLFIFNLFGVIDYLFILVKMDEIFLKKREIYAK